MSNNVKIIGIAGGSASGKTTIAQKLSDFSAEFGEVNIMKLDNYYIDRSNLSIYERENINYDHPSSFDVKLLQKHLSQLKSGNSVEMPIYNFVTHTREKNTITILPTRVIILEGILVLAIDDLNDMIDIRIYVDTPDDIRFIRRLTRDINERGRNINSVVFQYLTYVRPMHEAFVIQSKSKADIIIPEGGNNRVAIDILHSSIVSILKNITY